MIRLLSTTVLICLLSVSGFGQDLLTNKAVIEMVKAGLSPDIIVAKIQASHTSFDTSTEALKLLSDSNVPDRVVVAMITEAGKVSKAESQSAKETDKVLSSIPEQGKLKDVLKLSKVYISTEDLKARDIIEKELSKLKKFNVVDTVEKSDFFITFDSWTEVVNVTGSVYGNTATVRENKQLVGLFSVKMLGDSTESGRQRLIYAVRKAKYFIWESHPAETATKQFIKDLTKAAALAGS